MTTGNDCGRDELREVSRAVLAVTSHLSVGEVLQTIVSAARRLLGARYAALGVPDDAGSFAKFVVDGVSDDQWRAIGPLPRQHGMLALLLRDPAPVRVSDIRAHPRFGWWPRNHPELRDFLGMPIADGDRILGALYLANKETPGGFTADDEDLLRILAAHAAIALVNARLYERSRELSIMEERNRIARELHDAVSQKLFSLRLTAEAAATLIERALPSEPGPARSGESGSARPGEPRSARPADLAQATERLAAVRALAAEAADELRAIVVGLRPADVAGDGLDTALRKQAELLDRVHEASVTFVGGGVPRLTAAREQAVYRVAQEALHNALRHAEPRTVEIFLTADAAAVTLEVRDDGRGFDRTGGASLGLASMRDRARAVGGRLLLRSRPEGGTAVRLEVPVG